MEMQSVESSNIAAAGYDAETRTLRIRFKSGAEYEYDGVPKSTYEELMDSATVGGFFHRHVRGFYPAKQVA